jgi:hypothetical protein
MCLPGNEGSVIRSGLDSSFVTFYSSLVQYAVCVYRVASWQAWQVDDLVGK